MSQNVAVESAEAISKIVQVARTLFPEVEPQEFGMRFVVSVDERSGVYLIFKADDALRMGIDEAHPFARIVVEKF